jgi:hypothetical protein
MQSIKTLNRGSAQMGVNVHEVSIAKSNISGTARKETVRLRLLWQHGNSCCAKGNFTESIILKTQ